MSTAVLVSVTASSYYGPSKEAGSPGVLGFVMTFLAAALVVVIALAMTTSLRRVNQRARREGLLPERGPQIPVASAGGRAGEVPADAPSTVDAPPGPGDPRPDA